MYLAQVKKMSYRFNSRAYANPNVKTLQIEDTFHTFQLTREVSPCGEGLLTCIHIISTFNVNYYKFANFDLRTGLRTIKIREKRKISDFSYLFNKPSFYGIS